VSSRSRTTAAYFVFLTALVTLQPENTSGARGAAQPSTAKFTGNTEFVWFFGITSGSAAI
jgi:hypothetical protein